MKKAAMRLFTFILVGVFSSTAIAADRRLSKEEFLERIMKDQISLERGPVLSIPDVIRNKVFESQKKLNPTFKEEMWYVHYIRDNKFLYSVFYEWWEGQCKLRIEEIDPNLGKPNGNNLDPVGQKIDKKYCEKLYGTKL